MNGDHVIVDPNGLPRMVETMALIDDTVGMDKALEPRMCGSVTISVVCAGLTLLVEEVVVELGPSIDKGGATIPKMGLLGSKDGKG